MSGRLKSRINRILAGALAVTMMITMCGGDASMEAYAQRETLPGVEKVVAELTESGESYLMLEVVPSKDAATLGYLVEGQESVSDGNVLADLPSEAERAVGIRGFEEQYASGVLGGIVGDGDGYPVSYAPYREGSGSNRLAINGGFVQDEAGAYNLMFRDAVYRKVQPGEVIEQTRYDKKYQFEDVEGITNASEEERVFVTFNKIAGDERNPHTDYVADGVTDTAYASGRYAMRSSVEMSDISREAFVAEDYLGRDVYIKTDEKYAYYGKIMRYTDIPEEYLPTPTPAATPEPTATPEPSVSSGDSTVSGNDASQADVTAPQEAPVPAAPPEEEERDRSADLYVLSYLNNTAVCWAMYYPDGSYIFDYIAGGHINEFESEVFNGDYYVSTAYKNPNGNKLISYYYEESSGGEYIMESAAMQDVVYITEEAFDESQGRYRFVRGYNGGNQFAAQVAYSGGFTNNEWFEKYVFDLLPEGDVADTAASALERDAFDVQVKSVTVDELIGVAYGDLNLGFSISDVDFIYLAGGAYEQYEDVAPQGRLDYAATMLGAYAVNRQIPVVMDYSFIESNASSANAPLVEMAVLMILNQSADMSAEAEKLGYVQGDRFFFLSDIPTESWQSYEWSVHELFGSYRETLAGHVYVHDDTDNGYVYSDFLTDWSGGTARISAAEKQDIYVEVLEEIDSENFLRELNEEPLLERVLSKATITRYIINYRNQRVKVKEVINVLDVEPCYASLADGTSEWLTEEEILSFLPDGSYEGRIYITRMSSSEFIGRVEDLNESYDMIYLGDSVLRLNASSNGETVFNDSMMNGLVYYNIGDIYTYRGEDVQNTYRLWNTTISDASDTYRGTGNDINSTRQDELIQYISAGYAFVLADSLITYDSVGYPIVNKARVDCNSKFYEVLEFALSYEMDTLGQRQYRYWQKNVYTESLLVNNLENQENFVQYLNLSKLKITFEEGFGQSKPTSYIDNYGTANMFLSRRNGRYELEYIFSLDNYSAVSQIHTTYDCKLYVDSNADGRYAGSDYSLNALGDASTEELLNLDIYVYRNRAWEPVGMVYDTATGGYRYQLMTGNIYRVVRALPEDYQGLVPWKLVFYDNSNPLVRCSEIGYSAVRSSSVETINVLQLLSDENNQWNLGNDPDILGLLADVEDDTGFRVNLRCVAASDFFSNSNDDFLFGEQREGESIDDYYYRRIYDWIMDDTNCNMIILGFADNYQFGRNDADSRRINAAAAKAIRDYIEAGKSILFTHDSSSYVNYYIEDYPEGNYGWYWGYEFNKTIRAAVGLDRYGALRYDYAEGSEYREILDSYQYAEAYQPGLEITRDSLLNYLRNKYSEYTGLKSSYASALSNLRTWDAAYRRVSTYNNLASSMVSKYATKIQNLENGGAVDESYATVEQIDGLTDPTVVRKLQQDLADFHYNNNAENNNYFYNKNSLVRQALYTRDTGQYWFGQYKAWDNGRLTATPVNQGQITSFPYVITNLEDNVAENDYLVVAQTHYQWLQPNMELDRDGDGKNDIVVWYCLSDLSPNGSAQARSAGSANSTYNIYNMTPNDVVNNYYIYNMGNVTYSGVGHSTPDSINEKKLFINTMVAAYSAGTKAPNMELTEDGSHALNTILLTYDRANKLFIAGAEEIEASVKVSDYNLLSDSQIRLELYVEDENGEMVNGIEKKVSKLPMDEVTVKNTLIADTEASRVARTESDDGDSAGIASYFNGGFYVLTPNVDYDISIKTTALGFYNEGDVNGNIVFDDDQSLSNKIYLRATTVYNEGMLRTPSATKEILIGISELFELK